MSLGERSRLARDRQGYFQNEAAALLGMGDSQLSRIESNKTKPKPEHIRAMAILYKVSSDYLLGIEANYRVPHGVSVIAEESDYYLADLSALTPDKRKVVRQMISAFLQSEM